MLLLGSMHASKLCLLLILEAVIIFSIPVFSHNVDENLIYQL